MCICICVFLGYNSCGLRTWRAAWYSRIREFIFVFFFFNCICVLICVLVFVFVYLYDTTHVSYGLEEHSGITGYENLYLYSCLFV